MMNNSVQTKKRLRKLRKRQIIACVVTALVLSFLILAIFLITLTINIFSASIKSIFADGYIYQYSNSTMKANKKVSYESDFILREGCMYVNFSALSDYCSFVVSGDENSLRYLLKNEYDDQISVTVGTNSVILSDQMYTMNYPSFLDDNGDLYLPCEFVNSCFEGIDIYTDEDNEYLIHVIYPAYDDVILTIRKPEICETVHADT